MGDWGGFRGDRDTDGSLLERSGVWEKGLGVWDGSMDASLFYIIFYSSFTITTASSIHPLRIFTINSSSSPMPCNFCYRLIVCLPSIKQTH
jgi:hypothetical protein